jgi:hypothetical protein
MTSLIQALFDLGDGFPKEQTGLLDNDFSQLAWRITFFGLKRERDKKKRLSVLKEAMSNSKGLALPVELVSRDERVAEPEASGHEFLLDDDDLGVLKNICVEKLRSASRSNEFRRSPLLRSFLWRWSQWGSLEEVRTWLDGHLGKPIDATWLLSILLDESHSYGREHKVHYSITLGVVERFADVARLNALLSKLKSDKLTKRETIAVREFNKAVTRRTEGKPDDAGRHEYDDADAETIE